MFTFQKLALISVLILALVGCVPAQEIQIVQSEERSITVMGEGVIKVAPDMVQFAIGIETTKKQIPEAKEANDEIVRKVMAVLKNYDIDDQDIKTDYLKIVPDRDYDSSYIKGYVVTNSIKITVRDLTKFEPLLTEVLEAGANRIYGIYFQVSDLSKYQEQARTLAIQAAEEKAQKMAGELGQEIGKPLTIQESSSNNPYIFYSSYATFGLTAPGDSYNPDAANTVAFGQLTINVFVTVEFQLK